MGRVKFLLTGKLKDMTNQEIVSFVSNLIETHRVEIEERPGTTPVRWKGINMTVEEAKYVIKEFETKKLKLQQLMNRTQTGGEITQIAANGTGLVAIVTGAALLLFPPTAIAGAITLAAGVGTAGIGKMVGEGVNKIGTNSSTQEIQQIDAYIDSIKNAIISII
jgi:hypothetical protein